MERDTTMHTTLIFGLSLSLLLFILLTHSLSLSHILRIIASVFLSSLLCTRLFQYLSLSHTRTSPKTLALLLNTFSLSTCFSQLSSLSLFLLPFHILALFFALTHTQGPSSLCVSPIPTINLFLFFLYITYSHSHKAFLSCSSTHTITSGTSKNCQMSLKVAQI